MWAVLVKEFSEVQQMWLLFFFFSSCTIYHVTLAGLRVYLPLALNYWP